MVNKLVNCFETNNPLSVLKAYIIKMIHYKFVEHYISSNLVVVGQQLIVDALPIHNN